MLSTSQPSLLGSLNPASGRVILFEKWALADITPFPTRAAYVAALDANYASLLSKMTAPATVAPLSRAWEQVFATKPQSFLFVDGKHPNGAGIYLNACVYYAIVFQDTPVGLPNLYLSASDAAFLQTVAAQVTAPPSPDASDAGADAGATSDRKDPPADPPVRTSSAAGVGAAGCSSTKGAAGCGSRSRYSPGSGSPRTSCAAAFADVP